MPDICAAATGGVCIQLRYYRRREVRGRREGERKVEGESDREKKGERAWKEVERDTEGEKRSE